MNIAIGTDHAGVELKAKIKGHLKNQGIIIKDFGTHNTESVDYPDFGHLVAEDVQCKMSDFGIVICGSGNGINMTVNKHKRIRSVLSWSAEIAELGRRHNDANILALPARFISTEEGIEIVDAFLKAEFEGGHHQKRVNKISEGV